MAEGLTINDTMGDAMVLGAGIQGVCCALALAAAGQRVTLIDRAPAPMLRASLRNEGKVHLGFIYANDPGFRTADLMLDSALSFARLIDAWAGPADWDRLRAPDFTYLALSESMLSRDALSAHYDRLESALRARGTGETYLGRPIRRLWTETPVPGWVAPGAATSAFQTAETAIDLPAFRAHMLRALTRSERITVLGGHHVDALQRTSFGFVASGPGPDGAAWSRAAGTVYNCLWEGRLAIDRQMGVAMPENWVHRLKYRVMARLPRALSDLPSVSLVLGPFGDVVPLTDQSYLSWYPACRRGWSRDLAPPSGWDAACDGAPAPDLARTLPAEVLGALDRIIPGMAGAEVRGVDAGIVYSRGDSDIDVPDSALHARHETGPVHADGYVSIDTGKFSCAPLFAARAVRVLA